MNDLSPGVLFSNAFFVAIACRDPYRLCSSYVLAPFAWIRSVLAEKSEMFLRPDEEEVDDEPAEGGARRSWIR